MPLFFNQAITKMNSLLTLATFGLLTAGSSLATNLNLSYTTTLGVIGTPSQFQAHSFTFTAFDETAQKLTLNIDSNFGGGFSHGAFQPFGSGPYNIGDIFLWNNSGAKYGIAMTSHGGLVQGDLYLAPNVFTASHEVGNYAGRPNQEVRINPIGAVIEGAGTITAVNLGGYEYNTMVAVDASNPGFQHLLNGQFFFDFESATCGNDVIHGAVSGFPTTSATPEPSSLLLLGGGAVALGLMRREAIRKRN